jgi:hypothetical protein
MAKKKSEKRDELAATSPAATRKNEEKERLRKMKKNQKKGLKKL